MIKSDIQHYLVAILAMLVGTFNSLFVVEQRFGAVKRLTKCLLYDSLCHTDRHIFGVYVVCQLSMPLYFSKSKELTCNHI